MRSFFSYGPLDTEMHYYAPREDVIEKIFQRLTGENPRKGGHYITIWGPRQTGKTWIMQQILFRLQDEKKFDVLKINLESLKDLTDPAEILNAAAEEIGKGLHKPLTGIRTQRQLEQIFSKEVLEKPLILILDEFDALAEEGINAIVGAFRNIYITRKDEKGKSTAEKTYLLHSVALVGVRSVLGIENVTGSPFNVQRSVHIPNLTYKEVKNLFGWYEKESGQVVEKKVIDEIYKETSGQPGLTCWFGELLTEGFEQHLPVKERPIQMTDFETVYEAATYILPSSNIQNIISKVSREPEKLMVLNLFRTGEKILFRFDNKTMNALYMNGVIDWDNDDLKRHYIKFSCPFVQRRLFNYFSDELFNDMGTLIPPFTNLDDVITDSNLDLFKLLRLYQAYLDKNREWLFTSVPRRNDMRIYEAVFHFNLYSYLERFFESYGNGGRGGRVVPEFPTGNGQIDLLLSYAGKRFAVELKSFSSERNYRDALKQAARYGKKLLFKAVFLVVFVQFIDEETRKKFENEYNDEETGVSVIPVFIETRL